MRVIAILNQKGGSGKTTTSVNLASTLTAHGQRVLLIDLDPQASTSYWYGFKEKGRALYDLLTDDLPFEKVISTTSIERLSIVPSSPLLSGVEKALANELAAESILKNKVNKLIDKPWDFILMDCPPTLGVLALNALTFANEVLIPVETHVMALSGLVQLLKTIHIVQERLNPHLKIAGILPCRVDLRTNHSQEVVGQLRTRFEDKVCKTVIRENIRLAEAPLHLKPINLYDPQSNGAKDYNSLAMELLGIEEPPQEPKAPKIKSKTKRTKATDSSAQADASVAAAPAVEEVPMAVAEAPVVAEAVPAVEVCESAVAAPAVEGVPMAVAEVPVVAEAAPAVEACESAVAAPAMEAVPMAEAAPVAEVRESAAAAPAIEEMPTAIAEVAEAAPAAEVCESAAAVPAVEEVAMAEAEAPVVAEAAPVAEVCESAVAAPAIEEMPMAIAEVAEAAPAAEVCEIAAVASAIEEMPTAIAEVAGAAPAAEVCVCAAAVPAVAEAIAGVMAGAIVVTSVVEQAVGRSMAEAMAKFCVAEKQQVAEALNKKEP